MCKLSLNEYGPTLPLAAALNRAYSKSKASKIEYLAVKVDDLLLLSELSLALDAFTATAAAIEVSDEVVDDDGDITALFPLVFVSDKSSVEL